MNETKTEEYIIPRPKPPPKPPPDLNSLLSRKDDKIRWSELDWITNYKLPETKNTTPDWKSCKLLGSLLNTEKDINRRKHLSINAMQNLECIFKSKIINTPLKIRTFNAYVASIFLYNSEIWTLTTTLEQQTDTFHRKILRITIGIKWPRKISNKELYKLTKVTPWSVTIKKRRLNWLGHVMRLNHITPARQAIEEFLKPHKRPVGRPITT